MADDSRFIIKRSIRSMMAIKKIKMNYIEVHRLLVLSGFTFKQATAIADLFNNIQLKTDD